MLNNFVSEPSCEQKINTLGRTLQAIPEYHRRTFLRDRTFKNMLFDILSTPPEDQSTPLQLACHLCSLCQSQGHTFKSIIACQLAVIAPIDLIEETNSNGETVLMRAANSGLHELVKTLIHRGADLEKANLQGHTALFYAAKSVCDICTSHLLEAGANVHASAHDNTTPLMMACILRRHNVVDKLIQANVNVNAKDDEGKTALTIAVRNNQFNTVRSLLDANANVKVLTRYGQSLLQLSEDPKIFSLLLQRGADLFAPKDQYGNTALTQSALLSKPDNLKSLLRHTSYFLTDRQDELKKAIIIAVRRNRADNVRALLGAGVDVNTCDQNGNTLLMHAARLQSLAVLKILLSKKYAVDIHAQNYQGWTALSHALDASQNLYAQGYAKTLKPLLDRGASVPLINIQNQLAQRAFSWQRLLRSVVMLKNINDRKELLEFIRSIMLSNLELSKRFCEKVLDKEEVCPISFENINSISSLAIIADESMAIYDENYLKTWLRNSNRSPLTSKEFIPEYIINVNPALERIRQRHKENENPPQQSSNKRASSSLNSHEDPLIFSDRPSSSSETKRVRCTP